MGSEGRLRVSTEIGETLRRTREEQGRSVQEVAEVLRMRSDYVRALEDERFDAFGGDIYARGFLRNYASELGIDPQPLLDAYRREHGEQSDLVGLAHAPTTARAAVPRSSPPPWIAWVLVAVVVIAGLAFIGTLGSGRTPGQASPDPTTAPPPPADTETEDPQPTEPESEETEPEPDPEPTFEGVEVVLAFEEDSWTRVIIDGGVDTERLVEAGETLQFNGEDEVVVRLGNAGGVRAQVNGEEVDSLGARGDVVDVRFTETGVESI